jgi:hypothetical protein
LTYEEFLRVFWFSNSLFFLQGWIVEKKKIDFCFAQRVACSFIETFKEEGEKKTNRHTLFVINSTVV